MPIRIDQDDNDNGPSFNPGDRSGFNRGGGGGGGGFGGLGMLLMFLPQIIRFLFRNPKIGILVIIALVAFWFFSGKSCGGSLSQANSSAYSKGCDMKREVYDQAPVYEPLADNVKDPLPERVSLLEFAPPRLNQGKQGSCVAWASS
ncbi:MAG: C1 family peptidase, partial [Bacteroidia bacterium]